MKCLISGSTGLIGSALCRQLRAADHSVTPMVREGTDGVVWDARTYTLKNPAELGGFDAVIHLAGEPIVGRWNQEKKDRILHSRVASTASLSTNLAGCPEKPSVLIVASAIGYYGHRGSELLPEDALSGSGFLSEVCRAWEEAAEPARAAGIRVVHLRFGVVLSPLGGALKKMLPPFRMGLGGPVGDGKQYMSWITLEDAVGAIIHCLECLDTTGPINVVTPEPVTNRTFSRALGKALSRPAFLPLPAFVVRAALGEMGEALLLASQRVIPERLQESGYAFKHPTLEAALRHLLSCG